MTSKQTTDVIKKLGKESKALIRKKAHKLYADEAK